MILNDVFNLECDLFEKLNENLGRNIFESTPWTVYISRSGKKAISPYLKNVILLYSEELKLTNNSRSMNKIADDLVVIYGKNWGKIYDTITAEYDLLSTDDYSETRTPNLTKVEDITKNGGNTRKESTLITTASNNKDDNSIYGFNSSSPNPETSSFGKQIESVSGDKDNNVIEDTHNDTDKHTTTDTGTETTTIKGRKNPLQKSLIEELELRKFVFINDVFKDIDKLLTLPMYL